MLANLLGKDKASKSDYRASALEADTSGCQAISGMLKKQNKMGLMQSRFFYLNNEYLIYKETADSTEFKGVVDLMDVQTVDVISGKTLNITTDNGGSFMAECRYNFLGKYII